MICKRCGVKVTHSRIRRKRMGHIQLAAPVFHSWFFRSQLPLLGTLLGLDSEELKGFIDHKRYLVLNPGASSFRRGQVITKEDLLEAEHGSLTNRPDVITGAEVVERLLTRFDAAACEDRPHTGSGGDRRDPEGQQAVLDEIRRSGCRPELAVFRLLPVLPPDRRPLVPLNSGNFATSDLNDLYRRILNRNNRLERLVNLNAPLVIIRNEKQMLQEAVSALLDNAHCPRPVLGSSNRPLRGIAEQLAQTAPRGASLLEGLLRRPVDFSARTRLVADQTADLDTALVPDRLAWDLLLPLVIAQLTDGQTIKTAKEEIRQRTPAAWAALDRVCATSVVLAAPRFGPWRLIALRPRLTSELALKVHHELLDLLGWDNLGSAVKIFAVLTREAEREALEHLLPSRLRDADVDDQHAARLAEDRQVSPFRIARDNFVDELAQRALTRRSFTLGTYDHLILGAAEVFHSQTVGETTKSQGVVPPDQATA